MNVGQRRNISEFKWKTHLQLLICSVCIVRHISFFVDRKWELISSFVKPELIQRTLLLHEA